jgi:hypothetical protein
MTEDPTKPWPSKPATAAQGGRRGATRSKRPSQAQSPSTAPETESSKTPHSLEGNLLDARSRMGRSIIEIVEADFLKHGPEVIAELRQKNPAAYARLISDLVHFKGVLNSERIAPKRKSREVRMKELLKAMDDQPIDVNNPLLPKKHLDRLYNLEMALKPRRSYDLSSEELREAFGADLAAWYEHWIFNGRRTG